MTRHYMKIITLGVVIASFFTLASCASRPNLPAEFPMSDKPFKVERDLAGKTVGKGQFSAITGQKRGFTAYLDGTWDGQTLTLIEDFVYDDGEEDRKTWRLTKQANGEFSGTREDVVGTARGFMDGDVFRLEYDMRLPKEDGSPGMKVRFRDVLALREDGVVINDATVGYWGVRVARVSLEIERVDEKREETDAFPPLTSLED